MAQYRPEVFERYGQASRRSGIGQYTIADAPQTRGFFRFQFNYPIDLHFYSEEPSFVDDDALASIREMPVFPARGSVEMMDGVAVAKLANVYDDVL